VHAHHGALDKFMGDGMMVLFGAPNRLDNPCHAALQCAESMLAALTRLNQQLVAEGDAPLAVGIGINFGPVVAGWIGSTQRNNYSAIGDAVNVAARVEGLTKDLGERIIVTDAVRAQLLARGGTQTLRDLGEQAIKGHTPVRVWGVG
jgi:adenylate cyclase